MAGLGFRAKLTLHSTVSLVGWLVTVHQREAPTPNSKGKFLFGFYMGTIKTRWHGLMNVSPRNPWWLEMQFCWVTLSEGSFVNSFLFMGAEQYKWHLRASLDYRGIISFFWQAITTTLLRLYMNTGLEDMPFRPPSQEQITGMNRLHASNCVCSSPLPNLWAHFLHDL